MNNERDIKNNWKESHLRSVMKSFSWRLWATLTTVIISYFVTNSFAFAFTIGGIEAFSKIILFYIHERIWSSVFKFGFQINPSPIE